METRDLDEARRLLEAQAARRKRYPLAYAKLWDNPEPRTSQRRALALSAIPGALLTLILGGNKTGKSECMAMWVIAQAAGLDAYIDERHGRVEWVRRWLARNSLPESMIPLGPGRVWIASPTFDAAVEQIRPKIRRWCPEGSRYIRWDQPSSGEVRLPWSDGHTGVIVSKAYRQFDQDNQSWEGASPRAIGMDEEPNQHANLLAAFSRLMEGGRAMMALTHLRGKADWLNTKVIQVAPPWLRQAKLRGRDNPHIDQVQRELILAAMPAWQRAARDDGEIVDPEGAIYSFTQATHVIEPFAPPASWVRWQGIDWGGRAPHVLWAAECPTLTELPSGRELHSGDLVVYRELAPRKTTTEPAIPSRRLMEWAKELENGTPEGMNQVECYRVADSEDPGAIVDAAELGLPVTPAEKGPGSVLRGIELLEALLQCVDPVTLEPARPRVYVTSDCPILIEELEGMRWAEARDGQEPKPDPKCPDHGPDALRYVVQMRQAQGFR